ncbi:hypothetical protein NDU88_002461 [Pleurodeles waltl]|uniref:Secreted protein n=1 Tax=Pleurodeles waltl TaxID=8319 RepID=A0AAV7P9G3_PLEWA|nr:hypothetical protein NDU88_002461 [Pleurodeles waltl]
MMHCAVRFFFLSAARCSGHLVVCTKSAIECARRASAAHRYSVLETLLVHWGHSMASSALVANVMFLVTTRCSFLLLLSALGNKYTFTQRYGHLEHVVIWAILETPSVLRSGSCSICAPKRLPARPRPPFIYTIAR